MTIGKGKKRLKNQLVLHNSLKKPRTVWLTQQLWEQLQVNATNQELSCSEYIERKLRESAGN